MNERQRHILHYLTSVNTYIKTSELAEEYHISERTIRNDLYEIESFVSKEGGGINRSKSEGILLTINFKDKENILKQVNEVTNFQNRLSPIERMTTLLGMLIQKNDVISSKEFSKLLNVSRRTTLVDLKHLKKYLKKSNVDLLYVKNKGFSLKGKEYDIRRSYKNISNKFGDSMGLEWLLNNSDMDEGTIVQLKERISTILYNYSLQLTDIALEGLLVHISIAIQRLKQGNTIQISETQWEELRKYKEYQTAKEVRKAMEVVSKQEVPEDEAGFITLHLLGAKTFYQQPEEMDQDLKEVANKFIAKVSFQCGVDFMDDELLTQGLLTHLKPSIYRLKYHLDLDNPMKSYIKKEYGKLVGVIVHNIHVLEEEFSVRFNEDEICYIALHFRAAIERKEVNGERVRALLVCGSGVGTVQLLKSRLNRFFPNIIVVDCVPYHELEKEISKYEIDYIISTVPIPETHVPSILVNPFIDKEDRDKISTTLNHQRENLIEERKSGPVLEEVLKPELIELNVEVETWQSAVRKGGQLLVRDGKVEPRYIEAMIEMVKEHGPYVVLDKGVAMPHARPNQGVNSLCLSLLRLKKPIEFGHETNDPVHLVICLGSIDSETHLNALRQLVMLLNDKTTKEILLEGDKQSIIDIIKQGSMK
ncbi:BglG family transcription antiterminator [Halobacillus karajensis]|uniref:BglG family transcription antiterminator n=1 Tax=Halobacillus karajensis TaxID=195088 RepID=UPI001428D5B6|nr:BglG family transcription antiterminator [Halobacillus karajensis]